MDFFGRQDVARRNTLTLVALFALGVAAVVVAINLAVGLGFVVFGVFSAADDYSTLTSPILPERRGRGDASLLDLWRNHPEVFLWTTLCTLGLISLGCLYKWAELAAGGPAVAEMLGGRQVLPQTRDPLERQLLNVVEEMAIASGSRVPAVYVLDGETGINAFAAGKSQTDAVIGVTRGALEQLTRDELQGVIAHEFSHIVNRDMTLNLRLIAALHGIMSLTVVGYLLVRLMSVVRPRGRGGRNNGAGVVLALALLGAVMIVVGYLGVIFGRLIQAAVSRQREFLADAAAVQFTRNPLGLAGALARLLDGTGRLQAPQATEAAHLMFASLTGGFLSRLLATHPPLEDRIEAIAPGYLASSGRRRNAGGRNVPGRPRSGTPAVGIAALGQATPVRSDAEVPLGHSAIRSAAPSTAESGGLPSSQHPPHSPADHLALAAATLDSLPPELRAAASDPFSARAVVFGLLLGSHVPSQRDAALTAAQDAIDEPLMREIRRLLPYVLELTAAQRLPLTDLCIEALRGLSPDQAETFRKALFRAIWADDQVTLPEYCIYQVVLRALPLPRPRPPAGPASLYALRHDITMLLAVVLRSASRLTPDMFSRLLASALDRLNLAPDLPAADAAAWRPVGDDVRLLDRVVHRIAAAPAGVRRRVIDAVAFAISADRTVTVEEIELVRALAAVFDVPLTLDVRQWT